MMAGQEKSGKLTIKDIAGALHVSTTTVSRAVSGKGRIGEDTRERVLNYIKDSNYVPNAIARSLANSRTWNIGLIIPAESNTGNFFQGCLAGVCRELSATDYDVLAIMYEAGAVTKLDKALKRGKLDGAIVTHGTEDTPAVDRLRAGGVPFVLLGSSQEEDAPRVDFDHRGACAQLTALLLERYQNLALIGGRRKLFVTRDRLQGFLDAHQAAGRPVREELLCFDVTDSESVAAAVEQTLTGGADCLVCMDDHICGMVMSRLHRRGWRIPEDIGVASCYDSALLQSCTPPVTALHFDDGELGEAACRMLLAILEGQETPSFVQAGHRVELRGSTEQSATE